MAHCFRCCGKVLGNLRTADTLPNPIDVRDFSGAFNTIFPHTQGRFSGLFGTFQDFSGLFRGPIGRTARKFSPKYRSYGRSQENFNNHYVLESQSIDHIDQNRPHWLPG
ncbi:hypothetical protein ACMFMF_006376 [Clarireedia jacksonii]